MIQEKIWYPTLLAGCGNFYQLWRHITQPIQLLYAVKPQSKKTSSHFSEQYGICFSVMKTEPTSVNNVVLSSVMEKNYSTFH